MTFRLRLMKTKNPNFKREKYDIKKLKSPDNVKKKVIRGRFHELVELRNDELYVDKLTETFNIVL